MRAFRGLAIVFTVSILSLIGVLLTITQIGGLAPWTRWQFIGLFGVVEASAGIANIISPNVWRLPVAQMQTRPATEVRLAASTMLIPHWGGAARAAAGLSLALASGAAEGFGPRSLALLPLLIIVAVVVLALSALVARAGVARPDIDTLQIYIRRPKAEHELPPISLSASFLQLAIGMITLPAVSVMEPEMLFGPEIGPSPGAMLVALVAAVALAGMTMVAWWGRIDGRAPRDQQREAERYA
jgi:hypothetical protein